MEKPIVHYIGTPIQWGPTQVKLQPVDHQNHVEGQSVSNSKEAITSRVLEWDKVTGRIETLNTIYRPLVNRFNTEQGVLTKVNTHAESSTDTEKTQLVPVSATETAES